MKRLSYKKMILDIDKIMDEEHNFLADMECKETLPRQDKFTQEEAKQMSNILGRIYMISHCITCENCQLKYITIK